MHYFYHYDIHMVMHGGQRGYAIRPYHRSRSLKVTDFGSHGKPICNFLFVNNTNLQCTSHSFRDMANVNIHSEP